MNIIGMASAGGNVVGYLGPYNAGDFIESLDIAFAGDGTANGETVLVELYLLRARSDTQNDIDHVGAGQPLVSPHDSTGLYSGLRGFAVGLNQSVRIPLNVVPDGSWAFIGVRAVGDTAPAGFSGVVAASVVRNRGRRR